MADTEHINGRFTYAGKFLSPQSLLIIPGNKNAWKNAHVFIMQIYASATALLGTAE